MKKVYFIFCFVAFIVTMSSAQFPNRADFQQRELPPAVHFKNIQSGPMIVDTLTSLQQAIGTLFGPGVTVTNLTYTGPSLSIGTFYDTTTVLIDSAADFGIDTGIVMTTGSVFDVPGPNESGSTSTNLSLPGDSDLNNLIPGYFTYDAAVIEFDFTPQTDTLIACNFVFASEEYLEFVGSAFNDVFGFFISGPGFNGLENLAVLDSVIYASGGVYYNAPISVNTVNDISYSDYFVYNCWDIVEFDGYTVPYQLMHPITPGQNYHFKIAVADGGDGILDASVFMKAGSFLGFASVPNSGYTWTLVTNSFMVMFNNITNYATSYEWDFGDGTFSNELSPSHEFPGPGTYLVKLTANNYYQYHRTEILVTIPELQTVTNPEGSEIIVRTVNPGNYQLIINDKMPEVTVNIYSISGELIQTIKCGPGSQSVDISGYAKGIYSLQVISDKFSRFFRITN